MIIFNMGYLYKKRKIIDSDTSILEIFQHCFVNFLYGLLAGLSIATISIGNPWLILLVYYIYKQVETRILNRNRYTTRLGKYYIFPIPSTLGFVSGWYISELIQTYIK